MLLGVRVNWGGVNEGGVCGRVSGSEVGLALTIDRCNIRNDWFIWGWVG